MSWKIVYFESPRGERFVKEFIDKQRPEVRAKYAGMIDFLEKYGSLLSGKYTKKLKKNLYELRITGKEQIRIFYSILFDKEKLFYFMLLKRKLRKRRQKRWKLLFCVLTGYHICDISDL